MRWKLTIEYDGSPFKGWQKQKHDISIQALIEKAIYKLYGETVTLYAAGRTDAGVHALGQIAHCDIARTLEAYQIPPAINSMLRPHPICILQAEAVPETFHARFSATERRYIYRILNRFSPSAVHQKRVLHVRYPLDVPAMQQAAQILIGTHDFSAFRAQHCQAKTPIKQVFDCGFQHNQHNMQQDMIDFYIHANGFLYHQVRNIIGTLLEIGKDKRDIADMQTILESRNRATAGATAPPDGLYLVEIIYPNYLT